MNFPNFRKGRLKRIGNRQFDGAVAVVSPGGYRREGGPEVKVNRGEGEGEGTLEGGARDHEVIDFLLARSTKRVTLVFLFRD